MSRLPPAPKLTEDVLKSVSRADPGQELQDSDDESHSSGSSHSSYQQREREKHLGESGEGAGVAKPLIGAISLVLLLFVSQAIGFWTFTQGFLLTRTTLNHVTECSKTPQESWNLPKPAGQGGDESDADFGQWEQTLLSTAECTLPATHSRTFLWIIDALRYDFIADVKQDDSDWKPNPYYHNVLSLPSTLDKSHSGLSFLSHFQADAPTTTLQRLKGLTTGSLPTFVDAGSNFGGSEITEDNWLSQFKNASKRTTSAGMAMAGDDTWLSVFPEVFDKAWRFPFDSFNVEDLDGVDLGVRESVEAFLDRTHPDWRLIVAHTLGVDHVGHRLGASHPRMQTKLQEMQVFLKDIVERLPKDALLVLMGDHGMDDKGDHGGDGELEVGAGLWVYSKQQKRSQVAQSDIDFIVSTSIELVAPYKPFSKIPIPTLHRSIPQIDFVPTISLLLGLPIPFNNLGTVIPEMFETQDLLLRALRINAIQIRSYLQEYDLASHDLDRFKGELEDVWRKALQADARLATASNSNRHTASLEAAQAYFYFTRLALVRAESVWAKFEMMKMLTGLVIIALTCIAVVQIKRTLGDAIDVDITAKEILSISSQGAAIGAIVGPILKIAARHHLAEFSYLESLFVTAAIGMNGMLVFGVNSRRFTDWSALGAAIPIIHGALFGSNSFIIYESNVVLAAVIALLLGRAVQGYLSGPTQRLQIRAFGFASIMAILARVMYSIQVCREEQGPECSTTFYSQTQSTLNSPIVIIVAYAFALAMPTVLRRALQMSKSDSGMAPMFFTWMIRPSLLAGAGYWFVDWLVLSGVLGDEAASTLAILETAKITLARFVFAVSCVIAIAFWIFSPLCLDLTRETSQSKDGKGDVQTKVVVLGFANSFGSSYLLMLSTVFSLLFLLAQPAGQIALSLAMLCIVGLAELGDHERDGELIRRVTLQANTVRDGNSVESTTLPPSMLEISTLALLGQVIFFSTGHQATFASIQWRTAFVGFKTVQYPFSPLLVILNSFGGIALLPALTVPLFVLWNLAPKPRKGPAQSAGEGGAEVETAVGAAGAAGAAETATRQPNGRQSNQSSMPPPPPPSTISLRMPTVLHILQASLSFLLYHLIVALLSATFATHFKRHLMLFKVWTPRFMLATATIQLSFLGIIVGLAASANIMTKVGLTFGSQF